MKEQSGEMNLKSMLGDTVKRAGAKTAIVAGERRVTFAQLDEDSNRFAHALVKMGVKKGDRVAMIQASNPEFAVVFYGIIKAGGIAVPLDARYIADELAIFFNDCRPKVLVIENPPLGTLLPDLPRFNSVKKVVSIEPAIEGKFTSYQQIMTKHPPAPVDIKINREDAAVISYTGGPTQKPQGVVLAHGNICTEAITSTEVLQQTDKDVVMQFALPLYHQFGLAAVLVSSVYKASTVVMVPGTGRSVHSFMEAVEREKGTIYMGVPYIYSLMINVARREGIKDNLGSLRFCISGGAPLEPVVAQLFKKHYGFEIHDFYGQTETICEVTVCTLDNSCPPASSGKALPCWEIKIFDENDNELPPDTEGEIVVRGPTMTGFYNKPEATARAMRRGWLHTGDLGKLDKAGFLFITGRKRRMLILKGQNIFPADIEEVMATHPKIAEVKIQGVIDILRGETVKALVRLKPGETATAQEIRQFCQGRMADYKLPRDVEFVDKIPAEIPLWRRHGNIETGALTLEETG